MLKGSFKQEPETNNGLIVVSMNDMVLLLCMCLVTVR